MDRKLDLVLTNIDGLKSHKCQSPLLNKNAYHASVCVNVLLNKKDIDKKISPSYVYDYSKGDFRLFDECIKNSD